MKIGNLNICMYICTVFKKKKINIYRTFNPVNAMRTDSAQTYNATQQGFEYAPAFIKELEKLATTAFHNPQTISVSDFHRVNKLYLLTKLEAALLYNLTLKTKNSTFQKEELKNFLEEIRNNKIRYESSTLKKIHATINNSPDYRSWKWLNNTCSAEQFDMATRTFAMVTDLIDLFKSDTMFLFHLSSISLLNDIYPILLSDPVKYKKLINELIKLDEINECTTHKVEELKTELAISLNQKRYNISTWWKGNAQEWNNFIYECARKNWIRTSIDGKPSLPYKLLPNQCNVTEFFKKILQLEHDGLTKKLYKKDDRSKFSGGEITSKELLMHINKTFNSQLKEALFSRVRRGFEHQ